MPQVLSPEIKFYSISINKYDYLFTLILVVHINQSFLIICLCHYVNTIINDTLVPYVFNYILKIRNFFLNESNP